MARMARTLSIGSLWHRAPNGSVVRITAVDTNRVSYVSTSDPHAKMRSTWLDSFEKRYVPAVRMTLSEIRAILRASASSGVPAIVPSDACRLLLSSLPSDYSTRRSVVEAPSRE